MSRDSTKNIDGDIPRNEMEANTSSENGSAEAEVNAGIDPRSAAMQDLVRRRREERAEGGDGDGEGTTTAELEPKREQPDDEDDVYHLIVDGQKIDLPKSKMVANAQKYLAGDKRLAAASQMERELERRDLELRQREQEFLLRSQQAQQQSKPPGTPGASDDVEAEVGTALEAIYSGDDETAKKALAKLFAAGRQQPTHNAISHDEIDQRAQQAANAAIEQRERVSALQSAASKFKAEFNDVASDPELFGMADRFTLEIANENPELEPYQIMQEAGNRVRNWLKAKSGNAGLSDRSQRKRQAMVAVSGANAAMTLGHDEPPPKTRTDVIGDMKRRRGQTY